MVDLELFRSAKTLTWERHTVFAPHCGDDGTLVADGVHRLPLDTYTPDSLTGWRSPQSPMTDNVGVVVADPSTLDDVHAAVQSWCREQLGRDDIQF